MVIGNAIGIPFGWGSGMVSLPYCLQDNVVSWWLDFNNIQDNSYIEELIGTRTDTIYYGQYLDSTSGQIDFKRSSGTFDYTDPSDGSRIEDVPIPVNGLVTVPINGICDIGINRAGIWDGIDFSIYDAFYPVCETAGTVLHDIKADSLHITVDTPVWAESLYGSDYLNQYGFITKAESDALGYTWETDVQGTSIVLDNNTLIPFGHWVYELLYDVNGDIVYDVNNDPVYIKINT